MTKAESKARSKWSHKAVLKCTVRKEREHLGLTLRDVSRNVGLSIMGLCYIENGCNTQLTTALRIAEFFGKTVEELWPTRKSK